MASSTQDGLYQTFLAVSGQQTSALGDATAMLANVIAQVDELQNSNPAPWRRPRRRDDGVVERRREHVGSVASTVLESGFGLAPLISGLVSLFSGGDTAAPAPLVKYAMPAAADFQGAESQGQVTGWITTRRECRGVTRRRGQARGASGSPNGSAGGAAGGASPQITVNVQAMDARSFMDRSNDIAPAVRDAMLNLNSINDVVNDL